MSTTKFYKTASIAAMTIAGMTLTACATGQSGSRYGGNVYDYESGGNCGPSPACAPAVVAAPVHVQHPAPVVTQTYTAPAPVVTQSYSAPVQCPVGTTPSSDGTCLQNSTSYTATTTYVEPSYSYTEQPSYSSATTYSGPIECPPGTRDAGDGTCLQSSVHVSSGATTSYNSTTSYGSGSTYSGGAVECPTGTRDAGDGTCMQVSGTTSYGSGSTYSGSDVTIYSGDATPSGYTSTTTTTSDVYLPIRK